MANTPAYLCFLDNFFQKFALSVRTQIIFLSEKKTINVKHSPDAFRAETIESHAYFSATFITTITTIIAHERIGT